MKDRIKIIAEAGINHNGKIELAKKLIDVAADAGSDIVKFQTSIPELSLSKYGSKADYMLSRTKKKESALEMFKKIHLPLQNFAELKKYSEMKGIRFMSTPFEIETIRFLNSIDVDAFKIPSSEITDLTYLREVGGSKKEVIMSTGMSYLSEIKKAIEVLTLSGTKKEKITVLHCNSQYPTPYEDVNLNAMLTIKNELEVDVGYSDHTLGIEVPIAVTVLGGRYIEKHITLDRNLPGPDHSMSLEPRELKIMIDSIKNIEKSMGDGIKCPSKSEEKNIINSRKSIVASKKITKGEILSVKNLTVKRPGLGISAIKWDEIVGTIAEKDYDIDDMIEKNK